MQGTVLYWILFLMLAKNFIHVFDFLFSFFFASLKNDRDFKNIYGFQKKIFMNFKKCSLIQEMFMNSYS